ncbi:hypothetical protein Goklo_021205 [Gossypium klotzschianum]|uniref:DUF4283 domain-containing protein n=1 Tax=Gossypium klotzschianum TaxID=34286 RepID=A0A7J8UUF3_9ROSI|nr:hypothetical protein [Gossypium klotzschianum]
MAVDLVLDPPLSSKERLVGKGPIGSMRENRITAVEVEDDFDFMEGDITRSIVSNIWRPSMPFQLMDIENGYFLAKFHNNDDFEKFSVEWPLLSLRRTEPPKPMDYLKNRQTDVSFHKPSVQPT